MTPSLDSPLPFLWNGNFHSQFTSYLSYLDGFPKFHSGRWSKTYNLSEGRIWHNSWQREDGTVLLIGGDRQGDTTEIVSDNVDNVTDGIGVSTPSFTLNSVTK